MSISFFTCVVERTEDRADLNMAYEDETFRKGEKKEWVVGCVRGTEAIFTVIISGSLGFLITVIVFTLGSL